MQVERAYGSPTLCLSFHRYTRLIIIVRRWSSICRGATMWGQAHLLREAQRCQRDSSSSKQPPLPPRLMSPMVKKRLARGNYGFALAEPFDEMKHDPRDRVKNDLLGDFQAVRQMKWVVKRVSTVQRFPVLSI